MRKARLSPSAPAVTSDASEERVSPPIKVGDKEVDGFGAKGGAVEGSEEDEEDEPTTCAFCLFQRRGPCGQQFRSWERWVADIPGAKHSRVGEPDAPLPRRSNGFQSSNIADLHAALIRVGEEGVRMNYFGIWTRAILHPVPASLSHVW